MAVDIESFYRSYGPLVLRRCRHLLREEAKAVDAMQDVFVEILRRKDSLDASSPAGLLLTTATHVCLNRIRSERRKPEDRTTRCSSYIAALDPQAMPRPNPGGPHPRPPVCRAPESTRLIAVLYYVDRLTLEEVASEVGMSVSGVRKRLRTLKERLPAVKGEA